MNYVVLFKYHILCLLDNLCRLLFSCNKATKISKITLPSTINSFLGIYNSQIKLHIPLKKAVNASYKRCWAKRTSDTKLICWRFIHFIHVNGDARWTPRSCFRCTPQSNPAKILQLLMDGQWSSENHHPLI